MISLVVARDRNGAIGKDGGIPWHAPEDLRRFKRETIGGAVIMGRTTWESLPFKPLKDRLNIVVSRDASLADHVVGSVAAAMDLARAAGYDRIYGIGGQGIYRDMLPLAHRLVITEVDLEVDRPDAFFPPFDPEAWVRITAEPVASASVGLVLTEWLRKL